MKKTNKFLALFLFSATLFISCNQDDNTFSADEKSGWVQLNDGSNVSINFGTTNEIRIPLTLFSPVNSDGLDVTYDIVDVVGNSSSIISNKRVVSIERGELTSEIVLELPQSGLQSSIEFDLVLVSTSRSNVTIGLSDNSRPIKKRFSICPFAGYANSYTGIPTANLTTPAIGPSFTATYTAVTGDMYTGNFNTLWGPNYLAFLAGAPNGTLPYPGTIVIDSVTSEVEVLPSSASYLGGTGTINYCTGVITITLKQGVFTNPFTTTTVLTPN